MPYPHSFTLQCQPARRGFTLVELLVVLGILAVLLSLVIPAVGRARSRARTVKCAANLRTVGHALWTYASESKGWLPRDCVQDDREGTSFLLVAARRLSGMNVTADDLPRYAVLQCPEHVRAERIPGSYVSNSIAVISDDEPPGRFTVLRSKPEQVRRSSSVVYVIDASFGYGLLRGGEDDFIFDIVSHDVWMREHISPEGQHCRVGLAAHQGGANALMFDGSVQFVRSPEIGLRPFDDGRRGTAGRSLYPIVHIPPW